ncbi:AMP-binding protein [Streptomyces sp. H27-D2]|uniref:AMP-binding protein n=1 Tax=Streptomyces sp. H27-D2 TaxID=3046304 RepID=UPI002DB7A7BE|nr:AMP-binding protein [Streptomyces sp. H27-D2]MEC4015281.1 AMP-binding protein [Streptomyces sp. H27-D2]
MGTVSSALRPARGRRWIDRVQPVMRIRATLSPWTVKVKSDGPLKPWALSCVTLGRFAPPRVSAPPPPKRARPARTASVDRTLIVDHQAVSMLNAQGRTKASKNRSTRAQAGTETHPTLSAPVSLMTMRRLSDPRRSRTGPEAGTGTGTGAGLGVAGRAGGRSGSGTAAGDGDGTEMTPSELLDQAARAAAALTRLGVRPGDRVAVHLPLVPESVVATLACGRIEAVRTTLPVGLRSHELRDRIREVGARVLITADGAYRHGRGRAVKSVIDQALTDCPDIRSVLVVHRADRPVAWTPGRDLWWHEELATPLRTGRSRTGR